MSISGIPQPRQYRGIETFPDNVEAGCGGLQVALIAASGGGKTYVIKRLAAEGLARTLPTWTTRPPRPGESSSEYDHVFVAPETFETEKRLGGFAIAGRLYGHDYGLPVQLSGSDDRPSVVALKASAIPAYRDLYPHTRVFQLETEEPIARIGEVMALRGQHPADIARRLEAYPAELAEGRALADETFSTPGHPAVIYDQVREALLAAADDHVSHCHALTAGRLLLAGNLA